MPSEKVLEQKKLIVSELENKLKSACVGILVNYKGINVGDDTKLRKELREANVDYSVVKNTLLSRAASNVGLEEMNSVLEGTTALAVSKDDYISAAKILCSFSENNKFFKVKLGFIDGKIVDVAEVNKLASLPSKEILVSKVLGGLNAPISGLANVLNGTIKGLVVALNAIVDKKSA